MPSETKLVDCPPGIYTALSIRSTEATIQFRIWGSGRIVISDQQPAPASQQYRTVNSNNSIPVSNPSSTEDVYFMPDGDKPIGIEISPGTGSRVGASTSSVMASQIPNHNYRMQMSADGFNMDLVEIVPVFLVSINGYNARAATIYIKVYDQKTDPVVGSDIPVLTFAVPASQPFDMEIHGYETKNGLGILFSTGAEDNHSGQIDAADILGFNLLYRK